MWSSGSANAFPLPAGWAEASAAAQWAGSRLGACAQLAVGEDVSVGSSLKFCLLAEGTAQLYPRFTPTCEWDTAAGQAVLEAAGGVVLAFSLLLWRQAGSPAARAIRTARRLLDPDLQR